VTTVEGAPDHRPLAPVMLHPCQGVALGARPGGRPAGVDGPGARGRRFAAGTIRGAGAVADGPKTAERDREAKSLESQAAGVGG
jgi:hypothetical protein